MQRIVALRLRGIVARANAPRRGRAGVRGQGHQRLDVVVADRLHVGRQRQHLAPVQAAQALGQRRMRVPQRAPTAGAAAMGQQQVGQAGGVGAVQPGAAVQLLVGDLAQRAAQAVDGPRVLDGRGIGEELALATHCGLQQAPRRPAERADRHQAQTEQRAGAAAAVFTGLPQRHTQAPDHLQPPDQPDQAHVQARVAMHQVAELMCHHALQLGARQAFERAAGDGDDRIRAAPAGGKGVDRVVLGQHPRGGHQRVAAGQGHLVHDVGEAAFELAELTAARDLGRSAAGQPRHMRAALAQAQRFDPAPAEHEQQHQGGVGLEEVGRPAAQEGEADQVDQRQHRIDGHQQPGDDQREQPEQAQRRLPCAALVLAKAHLAETQASAGPLPSGLSSPRGTTPQASWGCHKLIFTALRSASVVVASSIAAGLKLNSPATMLVGTCCAALL